MHLDYDRQLEQDLENQEKYRITADANPRFGVEGPWIRCSRELRFLTPSKYGLRLETKIREILHFEKVEARLDRGDSFVNESSQYLPQGSYVEIKCSFFTASVKKLNLRQIRVWQDVQYYMCVGIEYKTQKPVVFVLNKEQMAYEVELIGYDTHGTKKVNQDNENPEKSVTVDCRPGFENYERWYSRYYNEELSDLFFNC